MQVRRASPALGAEIVGVRLDAPLDEDTVRAVYSAWLEHQVIFFRDQALSIDDQRRVTSYFGSAQDLARTAPEQRQTTSSVMYIGNDTIDGIRGDLPEGEMQFHTDGAYFEIPTKATLLHAIAVPSRGGDTLFASGYRALEALPADVRTRIESLQALNVYDYGTGGTQRPTEISADAPRFAHPVVIVHPETGRPSLYVNRLMTERILGLDQAESDALLEMLFAAVEQPEFVYAHQWRVGDLVVWDNRCTFHARTDFDPRERRVLRRMTTKGQRPRSRHFANR